MTIYGYGVYLRDVLRELHVTSEEQWIPKSRLEKMYEHGILRIHPNELNVESWSEDEDGELGVWLADLIEDLSYDGFPSLERALNAVHCDSGLLLMWYAEMPWLTSAATPRSEEEADRILAEVFSGLLGREIPKMVGYSIDEYICD